MEYFFVVSNDVVHATDDGVREVIETCAARAMALCAAEKRAKKLARKINIERDFELPLLDVRYEEFGLPLRSGEWQYGIWGWVVGNQARPHQGAGGLDHMASVSPWYYQR